MLEEAKMLLILRKMTFEEIRKTGFAYFGGEQRDVIAVYRLKMKMTDNLFV